ncbi:MAG: hypothetical protein M3377_01065 [Actinomycetota bacterium]|nr:hypothetical protein [Actinomycetota bacterium]
MGLLDFFRRGGGSDPSEPEATAGGAESAPDDRGHSEHSSVAGLPAEGPPVGTADPGSVTGEDATPSERHDI